MLLDVIPRVRALKIEIPFVSELIERRRRHMKERFICIARPLGLVNKKRWRFLPSRCQTPARRHIRAPARAAIVAFVQQHILLPDFVNLMPFNVLRFRRGAQQIRPRHFRPPQPIP